MDITLNTPPPLKLTEKEKFLQEKIDYYQRRIKEGALVAEDGSIELMLIRLFSDGSTNFK